MTMDTRNIMALARKHLGAGAMESSARLALADAVRLYDLGFSREAQARAIKSLAYSVGILHPDYRKAVAS